MKRKIYRIFFILLLVAITFTSQQYINADLGEGVDEGILNPIVENNGNERINNMFTTISSTIVTVLQVLGVAGLAFNGFKYMSAGAEGKSKIKENMLWILFGLLLITSADAIINIIASAGDQAF